MDHKKFSYRHIDELKEEIVVSGVDLPVIEKLDILKTPLSLGGNMLSNRLAIHPMEGCDSTADGEPDELTLRRYKRFGSGGASLVWFEACAINSVGRGNQRQLLLKRETLPTFKKMIDEIQTSAKETMGENFKPYTVLQLTHAGRYGKYPANVPAIIAVSENPYLDPVSSNRRYITDEELEQLEDQFVEAARLSFEAGFNAVDIKACHRYLISELLSAHTREGKYGGSFENRTRFLLNVIEKIKKSVNIDVTLRLNAYDAVPYPWGWGTDEKGLPSLDEPKRLMSILWEKGISLINISTGVPAFIPHIGRPADVGTYTAPEHPIESAARMLNIIKEMKTAAPEMVVIGTGLSWFREFGANIAAACIEKGWMDIVGFGRQAFAYPDFALDIIKEGKMLRRKCCIACTKCSELMRFGGKTGCVIKDSKIYLPIWREATAGRTIMSTKKFEYPKINK